MKITPAMLEAGVAAMARIKRQKPQDAAVVNAVFSAMHSAMLTEQKRLAGLETPKPYQHQAWPAWVNGPNGESRIFNSPEEVPEGWGANPRQSTDDVIAAPIIDAFSVAGFADKPKRKYTKRQPEA